MSIWDVLFIQLVRILLCFDLYVLNLQLHLTNYPIHTIYFVVYFVYFVIIFDGIFCSLLVQIVSSCVWFGKCFVPDTIGANAFVLRFLCSFYLTFPPVLLGLWMYRCHGTPSRTPLLLVARAGRSGAIWTHAHANVPGAFATGPRLQHTPFE